MSRIGNKPIAIPAGIDVKIDGSTVTVKKGNESLSQEIDTRFTIENNGSELVVKRPSDQKEDKALHGLYRSLINNMVVGLHTGFEKKLEINGVGFRAQKQGNTLNLSEAPEGVTFAVDGTTKFSISGIDKQQVGQIAANIRRLRKDDPYKGKGIKYDTEVLRLKQGKTGAKK